MAKKKGFMSRMIEGPERSENYARSTLPSNRWQLGWDILKNNFGKIVILNLILLAFAIPVFAILIFRNLYVVASASQVPFDSFMAYPYIGSLNGSAESIQVGANLYVLSFLPIAAIILSVGLSGVLYILRNMVWTEGVFVGSDFWRGVKKNFFVVLGTMLVYSVLLVAGILSISFSDYLVATGEGNAVLFTIAKVMSIIVLCFLTLMALHMLTMSVTYELSFFKLIRNAFILSVSLLPFNIFFAAFALLFAILYLIIPALGIVFMILMGLSVGLLIWTVYSHWIYDKYINERVPGAKRNRGIYAKPDAQTFGEDLTDSSSFDTVYLNKRPVKPVTDYDVEIVELPTTFGRDDLRRLEESKEAMRKDSDKYVEDVLSGKIKPDEDLSFLPSVTDPEPVTGDESVTDGNSATGDESVTDGNSATGDESVTGIEPTTNNKSENNNKSSKKGKGKR